MKKKEIEKKTHTSTEKEAKCLSKRFITEAGVHEVYGFYKISIFKA